MPGLAKGLLNIGAFVEGGVIQDDNGGRGQLVMHYEEGQTLTQWLRAYPQPTEEDLREIFIPVLDGLREVHHQSYLHRDVKPGNIYIRDDGRPMLIDFGSAWQALGDRSRSLSIILSEGYAAKEQYSRKGNQGAWTDLYGIGATLWRAVSGQDPASAIDRSEAREEGQPDPLRPALEIGQGRYSENLLEAIDWALAYLPSERPQTVKAFQQKLLIPTAPIIKPGLEKAFQKELLIPTAPVIKPGLEKAFQKELLIPTAPVIKPGLELVIPVIKPGLELFIPVSEQPSIADSASSFKPEVASAAKSISEKEDEVTELPTPNPVIDGGAEPASEFDDELEKRISRTLLFLALVIPIVGVIAQKEWKWAYPSSFSASVPTPAKAGPVFRDTLRDGTPGPAMVVIPEGDFMMGSPSDEIDRSPSESSRRVQINTFAIGQYEVTFEEYDRFCAATKRKKPSDDNWGRGQRPVINVSWNDAIAYTQWLSEQMGQTYRLPTEAEWEYAARAGTTTPFWTGSCVDTDLANYNGSRGYGSPDCGAKTGVYRKKTQPVGTYSANAWGLHDTMGNVYEWTCSPYDKNYDGLEQRCSKKDVVGSFSVRGGSWDSRPAWLRSAERLWFKPTDLANQLGFRLAKSL